MRDAMPVRRRIPGVPAALRLHTGLAVDLPGLGPGPSPGRSDALPACATGPKSGTRKNAVPHAPKAGGLAVSLVPDSRPAETPEGASPGRSRHPLWSSQVASRRQLVGPMQLSDNEKPPVPCRDGRRLSQLALLSHPSEVLPSRLTRRSQDCAGTPRRDGRMLGVA